MPQNFRPSSSRGPRRWPKWPRPKAGPEIKLTLRYFYFESLKRFIDGIKSFRPYRVGVKLSSNIKSFREK